MQNLQQQRMQLESKDTISVNYILCFGDVVEMQHLVLLRHFGLQDLVKDFHMHITATSQG